MITLTTNVFGIFALKDREIIKYEPFPDNPEEIAKRVGEIKERKPCAEEVKIIESLISDGVGKIGVFDPARFSVFFDRARFVEIETEPDVYTMAEHIGLQRSDANYRIREVNRILTEEGLKRLDKDQLMIQAIESLDDIEEAINNLNERLHEWYGIHFPEVGRMITDGEEYVSFVNKNPLRGFGDTENRKFESAAENSIGANISENDADAIHALVVSIGGLYDGKKKIERYIEDEMGMFAPNLSTLCGPLIGARLIAISGSIQRLAKMPASTIQILGAEEAFFNFLKTGKRPPKHGVIFQIPEIRGAKKTIRGKIARYLAGKIAIATRVDAFKGGFIGNSLRADFLEHVKKIEH